MQELTKVFLCHHMSGFDSNYMRKLHNTTHIPQLLSKNLVASEPPFWNMIMNQKRIAKQ